MKDHINLSDSKNYRPMETSSLSEILSFLSITEDRYQSIWGEVTVSSTEVNYIVGMCWNIYSSYGKE